MSEDPRSHTQSKPSLDTDVSKPSDKRERGQVGGKEGKVPYTLRCSRCHAMFWNPAIKKKTGPCSYGAYSQVGEKKCVWPGVPHFITWPNVAASADLA